jgi:molybdopterin synthase sulfur carrier subunit
MHETGTAEDLSPHTTTVLVRYFAAARVAAGVEEELLHLPSSGTTVADAVSTVRELHPGGLARILEVASFLLDGVAVRDTARRVPDGSELDVLPPFAGG